MKTYFAVAAIGLALAGCSSVSTPSRPSAMQAVIQSPSVAPVADPPDGKWKTKDGRFEVTVPSGWHDGSRPDMPTIMLHLVNLNGTSLTLKEVDSADIVDFDAYVDGIIKRMPALGGEVSAVTPITIEGNPAFRFEYSGVMAGARFHCMVNISKAKQSVVSLEECSGESRFGEHQSEFARIANSLHAADETDNSLRAADGTEWSPAKLTVEAERGNGIAMERLASMYYYGADGLPKDGAKAAEYLRQAANKGMAAAEYYLASMYHNGDGGLAIDEEKAQQYLERAAEHGISVDRSENGRYMIPRTSTGKWVPLPPPPPFPPFSNSTGMFVLSGSAQPAPASRIAAPETELMLPPSVSRRND